MGFRVAVGGGRVDLSEVGASGEVHLGREGSSWHPTQYWAQPFHEIEVVLSALRILLRTMNSNITELKRTQLGIPLPSSKGSMYCNCNKVP